MATIMTVEINDTLHVHICSGDPPYLQIERLDAGLVRIEANELRHLADVLTLAGADLAALVADIRDDLPAYEGGDLADLAHDAIRDLEDRHG